MSHIQQLQKPALARTGRVRRLKITLDFLMHNCHALQQ